MAEKKFEILIFVYLLCMESITFIRLMSLYLCRRNTVKFIDPWGRGRQQLFNFFKSLKAQSSRKKRPYHEIYPTLYSKHVEVFPTAIRSCILIDQETHTQHIKNVHRFSNDSYLFINLFTSSIGNIYVESVWKRWRFYICTLYSVYLSWHYSKGRQPVARSPHPLSSILAFLLRQSVLRRQLRSKRERECRGGGRRREEWKSEWVSDQASLPGGGLYHHCQYSKNESSEVCCIFKPVRRVKLNRSYAVNVHKLLKISLFAASATVAADTRLYSKLQQDVRPSVFRW